MEPQQNSDFMNQFLQLLLDKIKRESTALVLSLGVLWVGLGLHQQSTREWEQQFADAKKDYLTEAEGLRREIRTCDAERNALAVTVARMEAQINAIIGRKQKY